MKECIQIFSFEPTCIQEGRLAAIARLDLVELETFVDSVDKSSSVAATSGTVATGWVTGWARQYFNLTLIWGTISLI